MSRSQMRLLTGLVVLPLYLVASNCCLIAERCAPGCTSAEATHGACPDSPQASRGAEHSNTHGSEPAANPPADRDRPGTDHAAPCCDHMAIALAPSTAKAIVSPEVAPYVAVAPQIAEAPVLLGLGAAVILGGRPPPARTTPAQRSRAPPFA